MCVKLSHFSFWKPPIVGISWSFTRPVFWGFSPWRLTVPLHLAQSRHGLSKLLRFGAHPPDSHAGGTQWRSASWNRYVEIWMKYEWNMRMSKTLEFDGVWSLQLSLECPFRAVFDIRSSIVNLKNMLVDVRDGPIPTSTERSMRDVQRTW